MQSSARGRVASRVLERWGCLDWSGGYFDSSNTSLSSIVDRVIQWEQIEVRGDPSEAFVMPITKGFQVGQRVGIAMDALSASQKAALESVLQSKQRFVAHSKLPGVTKKLPGAKPLFTMKAGPGIRVIFTVQEDNISVLDVMRKLTMDRLMTKRKDRITSTASSNSRMQTKKAFSTRPAS